MVKKNKIKKSVTLDGLMTLGQLDDGRHTADFACCEDVQLEQLPEKLVRQAGAIAQKVLRELILKQQ